MMEYEALRDIVAVSRETYALLVRYTNELQKWNKKINLISDEANLWPRHIVDSLQLLPLVNAESGDGAIVDLGSGAGLPGLVVAMACVDRKVVLIESDRRKSLFLRHCKEMLRLPLLEIINERIEGAQIEGAVSIVMARALAPLEKLLNYAQSFDDGNLTCLFPKGKNWYSEVGEAKKNWQFDSETFSSVSGEGCVVRVTKIKAIK